MCIYLVYVHMHILYIYIYIYTPKPGRSPTRQYSVLSCFFPSSAASDFFLDFKKHFLLVVQANQVHQAEKHSFSAVSTSKSPGQRCSLAAASTWTLFFREEATKRPTLFIRLRLYRSSPLRSTLNTGYITGLGMCKVCTEAVHSVAL